MLQIAGSRGFGNSIRLEILSQIGLGGCRVGGIVQSLFRLGRHLLRSADYRLLRARSFKEWNTATAD